MMGRGAPADRQVRVQTGGHRVVAARHPQGVEVITQRVLETGEGAVVKEGRLDGEIPQGRRAELVAVGRVARDFLAPEILVPVRAGETEIAGKVLGVPRVASRLQAKALRSDRGTPETWFSKSLNISELGRRPRDRTRTGPS